MPGTIHIQALPNTFSFEMVYVEGGVFLMGNEDSLARAREMPAHPVSLDDFYIGKYTVTQALWKAVMGAGNNPSKYRSDGRPVDTVPRRIALGFIHKLNELVGKTYRLPTEAEWEYAARGGQQSRGYQYAGGNKLQEVGWYCGNSPTETKEVGKKYPNELGLYDMSGNIWEWCKDWYDKKYYEKCHKKGQVDNPRGPKSGMYHVVRGGRWNSPQICCRCTNRHCYYPGIRYRDFGFRLVLPGIENLDIYTSP